MAIYAIIIYSEKVLLVVGGVELRRLNMASTSTLGLVDQEIELADTMSFEEIMNLVNSRAKSTLAKTSAKVSEGSGS